MNRLGLTRSYVTCTFASALVSKAQISIWHICLILKLALYKYHIIIIIITPNILRPRHNGRHFPDDIFKCIFLNENAWILITIPLKFVPKGPINNIQALF